MIQTKETDPVELNKLRSQLQELSESELDGLIATFPSARGDVTGLMSSPNMKRNSFISWVAEDVTRLQLVLDFLYTQNGYGDKEKERSEAESGVNELLPQQDFIIPRFNELDGLEFDNVLPSSFSLIIVATEVELKALWEQKTPFDGRTQLYRMFHENETYYGGNIGAQPVVVLQCTTMGTSSVGGASNTANAAFNRFPSNAVVMPGIAAGKPGKTSIGDVLISSKVITYEVVKIGIEEEIRASIADAGPVLLNRFTNERSTWDGNVLGKKVSCKIGAMLSGEKLVANEELRDEYFDKWKEAIGIEMEGVGIYGVSHYHKKEWILLKSVCDFGDQYKSKNKKARQAFAARSSATFLKHALSTPRILESVLK